jgi:hypothetical protein
MKAPQDAVNIGNRIVRGFLLTDAVHCAHSVPLELPELLDRRVAGNGPQKPGVKLAERYGHFLRQAVPFGLCT